jgi:hypothetical protein
MTITYANGQTIKAALVVRTDNRLRAVTAGSDDVTEFTQISGSTWASEECEAVRIEFGFPKSINLAYAEEDFICPKDLAAQLIHLLPDPEEDEDLSMPVPSPSLDSPANSLMV